MPGPEHVITILLLWNIVSGSHSASVENRQYITRVDIPDAEDLSGERISVASLSKSWKELPASKKYILDIDSIKEFEVNPNNRDESMTSNGVSSYEKNSEVAPSSKSSTKEYTRDKSHDEVEGEQSDLQDEDYFPHNLDNDKGIGWMYHESRSNFKERKLDHNHYDHLNYPMRSEAVYRTSKRSPRCLKKCLTQKLLHPAQCHSLC